MERSALKTLFYPFETGLLETTGRNWLFLNAERPYNAPLHKDAVCCVQSFRPLFLDLDKNGWQVAPQCETEGFGGALVLLDRAKSRNHDLIADAFRRVTVGAPVLIAGEKDYGISSIKKWLRDYVGSIEVVSKYHAQVLIIQASAAAKDAFEKHAPSETAGLFFDGEGDLGSQLLASTFDTTITGDVADFCSGAGHLSQRLIDSASAHTLHLFEAELRALNLAEKRLSGTHDQITFHWTDLVREAVSERFDWIIMNPPFHQSRAAEPSLGQDLIRKARLSLRPGGHLRVVANRSLPYENTMKELFGNMTELRNESGFKVLQSRA